MPSTPPLLLALLLIPRLVTGQGEAPEDEALRLLERMDARIYDAGSAGLTALAFTFRPKLAGVATQPFRVRYSWRKGKGDRIDFLDEQGAPMKEAPRIEEMEKAEEQGKVEDAGVVLRKQFLSVGRNLAASARGRRYADDYRDFRRRLSRRTKNGIEWVSLILEPRNPKQLQRLTITLDRNGLPWQWERRLLDGSVITQQHSYVPREEQFVVKDVTTTLTAAGQTAGSQYATRTTWQRVKGYLLPATISKESPALPEWSRGATSLEDVKVDDDVPEFEPLKDA